MAKTLRFCEVAYNFGKLLLTFIYLINYFAFFSIILKFIQEENHNSYKTLINNFQNFFAYYSLAALI